MALFADRGISVEMLEREAARNPSLLGYIEGYIGEGYLWDLLQGDPLTELLFVGVGQYFFIVAFSEALGNEALWGVPLGSTKMSSITSRIVLFDGGRRRPF